MSGFFLMHRGWRDNPIFKGEFSRADAWVWLIENACWKPTRFDIGGKTVTLDRGQLCASVRQLADTWGWSKSAVERFLTRLKTETMIELEPGHGRNVITVSNYRKYQDQTEADRDSSGTATGTAAGQQRDIKEQGNKGTIEQGGEANASPSAGAGDFAPDAGDVRSKPRAKPKPVTVDLPDWIPAEPWVAFLEMRKGKGAKPTERALKLIIGTLTELRANGHDPGAVLDQSTRKNWTDVYPLKDNRNAPPYHSQPRDPRDGFERSLDRRLERIAAERTARADDPGAGNGTGGTLPLAPPPVGVSRW